MPISLPILNIRELLYKNGLYASKGLGQNFLQDASALDSIVQSADVRPDDTVLEIGPGLGSLTRYLAARARNVVAVELDHKLIPVLHSVLESYKNVRIVEADILKVAPSDLLQATDYLVVANVPYYITSAIFRHLLESSPRPRRIVLTVQKEVAERICATPGDLSLLALSIQVFGQPKISDYIPAEAFFPAPKIDSAVIRVDLDAEPRIPSQMLETFFMLAKAGFSQKRKTLRNSLSAGLRISSSESYQLLQNSGIDPMRRAETLSIPEWSMLASQWLDLKLDVRSHSRM